MNCLFRSNNFCFPNLCEENEFKYCIEKGKRIKVDINKAFKMAENGIYKRPAIFKCKNCGNNSQSRRGFFIRLCGNCQ